MFEEEWSIAERAARASGKIIRANFGAPGEIRKKGDKDLVTDTDIKSEETIVRIIKEGFPHDNILAEESGSVDNDSDRVWIIDPLDGTTNYAHGFPFVAVSIAFQVNGSLELGIVFNPILKEFFYARKGEGAFLNGTLLRVSDETEIKDALLATGFPYNVHKRPGPIIKRFGNMLTSAQGIRRPGSAAIDICYVAAGIFDGFWEEGLKPWDTAAGMLIASEAGAIIKTIKGKDYHLDAGSIVVSNPHLMKEMLLLLDDCGRKYPIDIRPILFRK